MNDEYVRVSKLGWDSWSAAYDNEPIGKIVPVDAIVVDNLPKIVTEAQAKALVSSVVGYYDLDAARRVAKAALAAVRYLEENNG